MKFDLTEIVLAGLLATLAMDLASHAFTLAGFYSRPVDAAVIGRWFGHMFKGKFTHHHIAEAPPIRHEGSIGFLLHYAIGIALALVYALLLPLFSLENSLLAASTYGVLTNALPWLWLLPSCGLGVMGLKGQGLLRSSFFNHLVFGVALYFAFG